MAHGHLVERGCAIHAIGLLNLLSPLVERVLHDVAAKREAAVIKLLRALPLGFDVSPPRERLLNELVGLLTAPALVLKERTCDFLLEFGDHAMLYPIGIGEAVG